MGVGIQVLLMTLQNAPPGLDLESDKRFTKVGMGMGMEEPKF